MIHTDKQKHKHKHSEKGPGVLQTRPLRPVI